MHRKNPDKPKYIFKNQLTNPDSDTQDKARYFADSFDFLLKNMGRYGFSSLENHRSLIAKIRFQLLNYNHHSDKYILHHARNPLLDKGDEMMKSYYSINLPIVQRLREKQFQTLELRRRIIDSLGVFLADLENSLMLNAMEEIHTVLHCTKGLSAHRHPQVIDYATSIIICEFRFTDFNVKDIDTLFERLLSRDYDLRPNFSQLNFPLPVALKKKQSVAGFSAEDKQLLKSFMENRSLRQQFEGITNLHANTTVQNKVLFKISNLQSKKLLSKQYGHVKLTSYLPAYYKEKSSPKINTFFEKGNVYIEAAVKSINLNSGQLLAMDLIKKELPRFELFYNSEIIVDYSVLLMKIDGSVQMKRNLNSKWLQVPEPKKNTLERKLQKLNSAKSESFQRLEIVYAQAKSAQLPEQKLNHYWRYFETSFGNDREKDKEIQDKLALILTNIKFGDINLDLYNIGSEILWENRHGFESDRGYLNYNQITALLDVTVIDIPWVKDASAILQHPFLVYRSKNIFSKPVMDVYADLSLHYRQILLEIYEQRNLIQHSGIFQSYAVEKLMIILPGLVDRYRDAILRNVFRKKYNTLTEVLEGLVITPKSLLKLMNNHVKMRNIHDNL